MNVPSAYEPSWGDEQRQQETTGVTHNTWTETTTRLALQRDILYLHFSKVPTTASTTVD